MDVVNPTIELFVAGLAVLWILLIMVSVIAESGYFDEGEGKDEHHRKIKS